MNKNHSASNAAPDLELRAIKTRVDLQRKILARLLLTYWMPLILVTIYFFFQYNSLYTYSQRLHWKSLAEIQANLLNLFLRERVTKIINTFDDPHFSFPPTIGEMNALLETIKKNSDCYVDIGFFDSSGIQRAYAGPFPFLKERDYSGEAWFKASIERKQDYVITDDYLGFREKPHFTIAVNRLVDGQVYILRATLDPERIYEYIASQSETESADISIVNSNGVYQIVTPHAGTLLEHSNMIPPRSPHNGIERVILGDRKVWYAYSWLHMADWALIVQWDESHIRSAFWRTSLGIFLVTTTIITLIFVVIVKRAKKLAAVEMETRETQSQLVHASKLATVGVLAAGISHEINNPLAVIAEETGLMKDLLNPEFQDTATLEELNEHLDNIHNAAFRCRDITHKLLQFVRKTDAKLESHDLHGLIDEVVEGLLGREMTFSKIDVRKNYNSEALRVLTDRGQLQQVLINLLNNAKDAIRNGGTITIETAVRDNEIHILVSDTGIGMSPEQLSRIFMPFYTTKEVGKGTGLGLSVSYGIIKNLGGKMKVESELGHGSRFTIILPVGNERLSEM